jgi:ankyrin repeat protein
LLLQSCELKMSKKAQQQQQGPCDEQQFWKILKGGDSQELQKALFISQTDENGEVNIRRATNAVALANSKNAKNLTPLCFVADNGYDDLIEVLVRAGAKVNEGDATKQKRTPLHAAIAGEEDVVIQKLLQSGADLSAVDADGRTVFHIAARMSTRNILQYLFDVCNGIDTVQPVEGAKVVKVNLLKVLSTQDKTKATALHYALGEVGGGDDALDVAGIFLKEFQVLSSGNEALVKNTLQSVTTSGCTALHLLAASGASSIRIADLVKQVIALGGDVAAVDADGQTALHYAAASASGNAAVFAVIATASPKELLIAERSETVGADQHGAQTPLEIAVAESNKAVITWIVADAARLAGFIVGERSKILAALVARSTDAVQVLLSPAVVSKEDLEAARDAAGDDDDAEEQEEDEEAGDYSGHGSTTFAGSRVQAARKAASHRRKENSANAEERTSIRNIKQNIAAAVEKKGEAAAQNHSQLGLGAKLLLGFMFLSFVLPVLDYLLR